MGQLLYIDDDGVNHWIPQKGNKDGEALVEIKGMSLDVGEVFVDVSTLATQATLQAIANVLNDTISVTETSPINVDELSQESTLTSLSQAIGSKGSGSDLLTLLNSLIDSGALKITTDGITVSGDFATEATLAELKETFDSLVADDKLNVNADMAFPEGLATEDTLAEINNEITDLNMDIGMRELERFDETNLDQDGVYTFINELNGITGIEVINNSSVNAISFSFGGKDITVEPESYYKGVFISADTSVLITGTEPDFDFILKVPIIATNEKIAELQQTIESQQTDISTLVDLNQPLVIQDTFSEADLASGYKYEFPEEEVDVYEINPNAFDREYMGFGIRNNGSSAEMQVTIGNLTIMVPAEGSFYGLFSTRNINQIEFPIFTEFDAYLEGAYGEAPAE